MCTFCTTHRQKFLINKNKIQNKYVSKTSTSSISCLVINAGKFLRKTECVLCSARGPDSTLASPFLAPSCVLTSFSLSALSTAATKQQIYQKLLEDIGNVHAVRSMVSFLQTIHQFQPLRWHADTACNKHQHYSIKININTISFDESSDIPLQSAFVASSPSCKMNHIS